MEREAPGDILTAGAPGRMRRDRATASRVSRADVVRTPAAAPTARWTARTARGVDHQPRLPGS
jgi:hypothetical protein